MADSFMDHIPSHERERIRKRMRSPEAYEKLRDKVKGPEDLEKEMRKNELLAEARFMLETEPALQDALKSHAEKAMKEEGIEAVLDHAPSSPEIRKALEQGKFKIRVEAHPDTHQDQLTVVAEGNVQERIPLKTAVSDRYVAQLMADVGHKA